MALQTRKPTGKAPYPMILLAGVEKSGKSWACAQASAAAAIGRTLWVGIGEDDPDEYGAVPGAQFEIVEHDGSYQGILWAFRDAVSAPTVDGKPTLLIGDSMTRLWNLIVDNAQATANRRAKGKRKAGSDDYTVTADLWNTAAKQWKDVMDAVRAHHGPVLLTARLDEVAIMEGGQPTGERTWKVQGHKSLPYDVSAIVQMRERGQFLLTGTRSVRMGLDAPRPAPGWTAEVMWGAMGVDMTQPVGERRHSDVRTDEGDAEPPAPRPAQQRAPQQQAVQGPVDAEWIAKLQQVTSVSEINPLWAQVPKDHPDRARLLVAFREHGNSLREQPSPSADPGWAEPPREAPQQPHEPDVPEQAAEPSQVDSPADEGTPADAAPAAWADEAAELRERAEAAAARVLEEPEADGPMALDGVTMPESEPESNGHTR